MEITHGLIYWVTRLDSVKVFFSNCEFACVAIAVFALVLGFCMKDKSCGRDDEEIKFGRFLHNKILPLFVGLFVVLFSIDVFVPNTKEMAAIIVVPKIVNNEKLNSAGNRLVDIAMEWASSKVSDKEKNTSGDKE